jgi:Tol biopolymer transport system component
MNCDSCGNDATIHITEIRRGLPSERHLCEKCADMFLPLEESDYADYLDILPPRHSTQVSDESGPTRQELAMTGIRQRVVVVDLTTGERVPVGPEKGDSFSPVWSPDSKRLAMCHSVETLQSLVLVEPGRTWMRRFLHTTFAEPPSWSADGRRLCFSHPEEGGRILLVGDAEEGRILRLTPSTSWLDEFLPVWSPRGDRIAFASRAMKGPGDDSAECTLLTMTPDGEKRLPLISLSSPLVMRLAWSGDARFLAALSLSTSDHEMENILEMPTGTLHLTPSGEKGSGPFCAQHPSGPTGKRVLTPFPVVPGNCLSFAWVSEVAGMPAGPIVLAAASPREMTTAALLIHPETRKVSTLAEEVFFPAGEVESCHLSADGRTLAALRKEQRGAQIVLVDVETGETREIEPKGEVAWLGWRPARSEIVALVRHDRGVRLEMISPEGPRRKVASFKREDFFDVPRLALSPDGKSAAVELHAPRKD